VGVKHDAAVDPSLPGRVLGDIGQPQLIGSVAIEVAADEVLGGRDIDEALSLLSGRKALEPSLGHQLVHELPRDDDLPAEQQLGADAPVAIDAARVGVDLADQPSQPLPPKLRR